MYYIKYKYIYIYIFIYKINIKIYINYNCIIFHIYYINMKQNNKKY